MIANKRGRRERVVVATLDVQEMLTRMEIIVEGKVITIKPLKAYISKLSDNRALRDQHM